MKSLILIAALLSSVSLFARDLSLTGGVSIGNGKTTILISTGEETQNTRRLSRRVRRLERAVADLQREVFNLSQVDVTPEVWECSIKGTWKYYTAQGDNRAAASYLARKKCIANSSFASQCPKRNLECVQLH